MKILICDDDSAIVDAIAIYMNNEGYESVIAHDGHEALKLLKQHDIHMCIIDIMMPVMDGLTLTHQIRIDNNIPILLLSAKSEDMDKIMGLNMGADDYLTKPFNPLELIARVKSQLRRYTSLGSLPVNKDVHITGGLIVDDICKTVVVDDQSIQLTRIEYRILLMLITHVGQVFSMVQIYEGVWDETAYNVDNTVAVHIRRIREKIEINPKNPRYLKVVWGIGYKIEKY